MSSGGAEPRVAVVTGANRGIGFQIAREVARRGLHTFLTARDSDRGLAARDRLRREGLAVDMVTLDVTDPESVDAAVTSIGEAAGRLDVLVNNAGIAVDRRETITDGDLSLLRSTFDTNFLGPVRLVRACVPWMRRHAYGRIVNVSSGRGSFSRLRAGGPFYRMSKTALNAMTVILADELKGSNILVNAMTPGWVRTRLVGFHGARPTDHGAETAVWLATIPDSGPTGKFFKDREEFPW